MQEFFLQIMDSPFLCQLACRLAAVIGVGCCQPDTDPALVDLEAQTALDCARRRVSERNRRKAALDAEMSARFPQEIPPPHRGGE